MPVPSWGQATIFRSYTYVGNDPTNRTDPTGKIDAIVEGAAIGCAVGAESGCAPGAAVGAAVGAVVDVGLALGVVGAGALAVKSASDNAGNQAGAANDGSKNDNQGANNNNGGDKNNGPPPAKGMNNSRVREAVQKGQQAHKEYEPGKGFKKEQQLPSGRRMDAYNKATKTVKELKPNTKTGIARGERQLQQYCEECNREYGEGHTGELETYDPNEQ